MSSLCDKLRTKAPNAVPMYCASHKTQRVYHDVTEVPQAQRGDTDAMHVRKGAQRLNNMSSRTAKFFNISTERWAGLRKIANTMGYHVNHGRMRLADQGKRRLKKYRRIQPPVLAGHKTQ